MAWSYYVRDLRIARVNGAFRHRYRKINISDRQLSEMIIRGYLRVNGQSLVVLTKAARSLMLRDEHGFFLDALSDGLVIKYQEPWEAFVNYGALRREGFITVDENDIVILRRKAMT